MHCSCHRPTATAMAQSRAAVMACRPVQEFLEVAFVFFYSIVCSSLQFTETGPVQQVCSSGALLIQKRGVSGLAGASVSQCNGPSLEYPGYKRWVCKSNRQQYELVLYCISSSVHGVRSLLQCVLNILKCALDWSELALS